MPETIPCPQCKNPFNPWFSRDKGKPQQYPYKACYSCKQAKNADTAPINGNGKTTTELMIYEELQAIHQLLERYLPLLAGKDVVKSFEPKTVSEDEPPLPENMPF